MPQTPILALPYPAATDPADVPTDMGELANRVEAVRGAINGLASLAADGRVPTTQLPPLPPAVVNGQWLKGSGGAMVWADITPADVIGLGTWQPYTVVWTSSGTAPSFGNATVVARYCQIGKLVVGRMVVTFGSTTVFGTGTWFFRLPLEPNTAIIRLAGTFTSEHSGGVNVVSGSVTNAGAMSFGSTYQGAASNVGATTPFTWAANDFIATSLLYEAL
jgi:hypothetical protein